MREQLIRYIDLLFAATPEAEDIRQEILQNTLDRYDDLTAQGKTPEAAYRLAISGIGDINEILSSGAVPSAPAAPAAPAAPVPQPQDNGRKAIFRAIAIALYILCPVPLFILQDEAGLCGLLAVVAVATLLNTLGAKPREGVQPSGQVPAAQSGNPMRKSVSAVIWAIALAVYFPLSFATSGWYITWVLFPMAAAVKGLVFACMDLKEASV